MKTPLPLCCLMVALALVGCGDDDENAGASTPVEACRSAVAVVCAKVFGCLTDAEEALVAGVWGNNEADCRTKYEADGCDPEMVKCDSDEAYSPANGKACVDQYQALSCAEAAQRVKPAICEQVCQ